MGGVNIVNLVAVAGNIAARFFPVSGMVALGVQGAIGGSGTHILYALIYCVIFWVLYRLAIRFINSDYYEDVLKLYTEKREYFLAGLDRIGLKHNVPQGTYFVMIDIQEFLDLPQFAGFTDLEFCEWMIKNVGVAAVPGSSFFKEGVNHLIRLHFARTKETIDEAINRLAKLKELV